MLLDMLLLSRRMSSSAKHLAISSTKLMDCISDKETIMFYLEHMRNDQKNCVLTGRRRAHPKKISPEEELNERRAQQ